MVLEKEHKEKLDVLDEVLAARLYTSPSKEINGNRKYKIHLLTVLSWYLPISKALYKNYLSGKSGSKFLSVGDQEGATRPDTDSSRQSLLLFFDLVAYHMLSQ